MQLVMDKLHVQQVNKRSLICLSIPHTLRCKRLQHIYMLLQSHIMMQIVDAFGLGDQHRCTYFATSAKHFDMSALCRRPCSRIPDEVLSISLKDDEQQEHDNGAFY